MAMLGEPPRERINVEESTIPAAEFAKYKGTYRNGAASIQIIERDGKLYYRSMELRKGEGGWLIMKTADGRTAGRIFAVSGADGKIEYLHMGGRASVRVM
jgi:hypothetical protein